MPYKPVPKPIPKKKKPLAKKEKRRIKKAIRKHIKPSPKKKAKKVVKKITKKPTRPKMVGKCVHCACKVMENHKYVVSAKGVVCAPCDKQKKREEKQLARMQKAKTEFAYPTESVGQMIKRNPKWLREITKTMPKNEDTKPVPASKPNVIKPAGAIKLFRFRRETDREYSARVGDARAQARLTRTGRRLSNKEIAYLMLHRSLLAYPEIAALSEMQTAAGHKLRGTRVDKIRNVLRRRIAKMLRAIHALLEKRGIIPTEITHTKVEAIPNAQTEDITIPAEPPAAGAVG